MIKNENQIKNSFNYQLITTINIFSQPVTFLLILKDKRIASSSADPTIKIFNDETYKIEIIIKEHTNYVIYLTQLKDGRIISSSSDCTIKIFTIYNTSYKTEQILTVHTKPVKKTILLENNFLASCSWDETINIWKENNNNLFNLYQTLPKKNINDAIFEINLNEFFTLSHDQKEICFYKFNGKNYYFLTSIKNIVISGFPTNSIKINEDFFLVGGESEIFFININNHNIHFTYKINNNIFETKWVQSFCLLNDKSLIVGIESDLLHFKINNTNLELINYLKNAHLDNEKDWKVISSITQKSNGDIITTSYNSNIKIWKKKL